jgi:transcriptional antiterminator Rof (Rho-off)
MKNCNYILIFLLTLSSCSNLDEKKTLNELYSQDFLKFQSENDIEIINLDSITNFSKLKTQMGQITCEGKVSGLRFEFRDTIYNITGFSDCPSSGEIGCYFRRNVISIRNDSLIIGYGKDQNEKPISYLKTELNNIMAKAYNFQYNENKVKPALIYFYVEDKYPISTTKRVLKEIAEQFSTINSKNGTDYFKYNILFESFDITKIPPPPPPPKPNEFDN